MSLSRRLTRRSALIQTTAAVVGSTSALSAWGQGLGIPVELFSTDRPKRLTCRGPFALDSQEFGSGEWQFLRQGSQLVVTSLGGSERRFPFPCRLVGGRFVRKSPRAYRGWILIQAQGSLGLRFLNWIDLEAYVLSVVTAEMPPTWPAASLQAQAILCRTRALPYRQPVSLTPSRWLLDSTQDQHYGGLETEHPQGAAAVTLSRGQILTHAGQPIESLYHSTCAGHTSANQVIFAPPPRPYLQGVACPYCQASPFYPPYSLRLSNRQLVDLWGSTQVTVLESDPWGRPMWIRAGSRTWSGQAFWRQVGSRLGWGVLPGNRFRCQSTPEGLEIIAQGAGHGVGLCQWGSRQLATQGGDPRTILHHYFPGTQLHTL